MIKHTVPMIIGNWKTTPATLSLAVKFVKQLDRKCSDVGKKLPKHSYYLAVADIFVSELKKISGGFIGAQNISGIHLGEITGDTVASQLASAGADFAIVGHSEVRAKGETVEEISHKVALSLQNKMRTVLCVGEERRDRGGKFLAVLEEDLIKSLSLVEKNLFDNLIIAYEPVWAIGKITPATTEECLEVIITLRRALTTLIGVAPAKRIPVLYGGSVTKDNAYSFIKDGGADGLLIGRASQDVSTFFEIIKSCHGI